MSEFITPSAAFLNYAPVPLAFGTSGLRGLVQDITDLEAYINVKGALGYLMSSGDIQSKSTVVIAGDLRPSTDRIMRACAQAILDSGCQVENAGKIPTPALIAHAIAKRSAGVMVTGSHIPFDRNGIKINKSVGEVLKSDEAGILRAVEGVRAEEYSRSATASPFDACGMLKRVPEESLRFLVVAIRVQSEVGSSLAEVVGRLAETIRNRQRVQMQIRALTAQSRLSGMVVGILPALVLGAFSIIQPGYAQALFFDPLGLKMLKAAIALDVMAFVTIRRLLRMDY